MPWCLAEVSRAVRDILMLDHFSYIILDASAMGQRSNSCLFQGEWSKFQPPASFLGSPLFPPVSLPPPLTIPSRVNTCNCGVGHGALEERAPMSDGILGVPHPSHTLPKLGLLQYLH